MGLLQVIIVEFIILYKTAKEHIYILSEVFQNMCRRRLIRYGTSNKNQFIIDFIGESRKLDPQGILGSNPSVGAL